MARFGRIDNGVVREIVVVGSIDGRYAPHLIFVEILDPAVEEGWLYDGVNFTAPPPIIPPTLDEIIEDISDIKRVFRGFIFAYADREGITPAAAKAAIKQAIIDNNL